jgi:surface carbohydrate biosynthesis protein
MIQTTTSLILPVENQVRELDAKLLLALIAARRGFASILGDLREVDLRVTAFPASIYLCKSMTARNLEVFRILRSLGHEIVSWDEEALVHLPDPIYYSRRLDPESLACLTRLFAWGEENADLWRRYPSMPDPMPIDITGNPRGDLLRPELLSFYRAEAEAIRREHGPYLLVNTNFNHVNAFYAKQNLFYQPSRVGRARFGKAGVGMTREFAERLRDQKQAVFEAFQKLIPILDRAFPRHAIVVRPHPTESQEIYRQIGASCERVHVTNERNVVPWLTGATAMVHNGCTTGVEAFALGVPAISYRPRVDPAIDDSFYRLPHALSHQCFDPDTLIGMLHDVVAGKLGAAVGAERQALIDRHVTGLVGPSACERIVSVLQGMRAQGRASPPPSSADALIGRVRASVRRLAQSARLELPGSRVRSKFYRHRYPSLPLEHVREKLARFERLLGEGPPVEVSPISETLFRVASAEGAQ